MEFNTNHRWTRYATRSQLGAVVCDLECALDQAATNVGATSGSCKNAFKVFAFTVEKLAAPSFMERVLAVHTVTCAAEDMAGTFFESNSDNTQHKSPPQSRTVWKFYSNTRSEIEDVLVDLGVVTKADVEPIVKSLLTKGPILCSRRS